MTTIAFAVMAHADPAMTRRLCAALEGHPIVLHVDATTDVEPFRDIPGVRLVEDRVDVRWGGYSEVEAVLRLYRHAVDELTGETDGRVALLSGADYPVRPLSEFTDYVASATWTEHVRAVSVFDGTAYMEDKVRRQHFFDDHPVGAAPRWRGRRNAVARKALSLGLPRRPRSAWGDWTPAWGSTWTLLSVDCLADVVPQATAPRAVELFRRTQTPLEMLFATLVHSSPAWGPRTEFGLEPRAGRWPSEFPNFHYIHPSLGLWLDRSWARDVVDSGGYFARKISSARLEEFLDAVAAARELAAGPATPART